MNFWPFLTALTLTPLAGGLVVMFFCKDRATLARRVSITFSLLGLLQALLLLLRFDPASSRMQFPEEHRWIAALDVQYALGVDGLGLLMVILSALVVPMALLLAHDVKDRPHLFYGLILLLQGGLFGVFTALNFFHWFMFWELGLIPAYFLIKLWGGPNRVAAATQFFIYTLAGSVTMLLGFQAIYLATGSFDFQVLAASGASGDLARELSRLHLGSLTGPPLVMVVCLAVFLGFAVKVPLMPFHTWLPPAYAEAPTSVTLLLTGAMSKMGVYGLLRIMLPLFPMQMRQAMTPLLWLALATIVFSASAAFVQKDLKRVLAYSSINHLGYCLLGIFALAQPGVGEGAGLVVHRAAALSGVLLQLFNHGIIASALFCFVGFIEQRSGGLRGMWDFGGLRQVAPVFTGLMGLSLFASLGLPGLSGFVGEFLIFKGVFALAPWAGAVAALGLLLTAVVLLALMQRVFHGPLPERWRGFADLSRREILVVIPALGLMVLLGVWPQCLLAWLGRTIVQMAGWTGP